MTQQVKKVTNPVGLAAALPVNPVQSKTSASILHRTEALSKAPKSTSTSLSDYTIKPIKDFAASIRKGDPKAVLMLLTALTALKYIASQQSIVSASLAAGQVATVSALIGPQGIAILGAIATAGIVMKSAQLMLGYRRQSATPPSLSAPDSLATVTHSARSGAIATGASVGTYAGRRLQIEGEARFEAGLQAANLSPNAETAVRVAGATLPVAIGAAATYGVLTNVVDVTPRSAAVVAGTLGIAELGRRGFNYYTRIQSDAMRASLAERREVLQQQKTTPAWEMATGAFYDVAGTCVDMTSNGLLRTQLGTVPALAVRTVGHTFAERHSLEHRGQYLDLSSGVISSLGSNFVSYLAG